MTDLLRAVSPSAEGERQLREVVGEEAVRRLREVAFGHRYPLLFATVSGAHLYGFASPDSDFDLRGVHVCPLSQVLGMLPHDETVEVERKEDGFELDLVTHDAEKFFGLLLKRNGYVLEQLLSPLVVGSTGAHEELKAIAPRCLTRHHAHHYLGFSHTQWGLFSKERRVKPLLYTYRVLLTGIHLLRTGEVEANLARLDETFRLSYVPELIARKRAGPEKALLADADVAFHEGEVRRLQRALEEARDASALPEGPAPGALPALHDLLVRVRMALPRG